MNCDDPKLIEGHNSRPRDIEKALAEAVLDEARFGCSASRSAWSVTLRTEPIIRFVVVKGQR